MTTKPRTYRETIHMPHGITVEATAQADGSGDYLVLIGDQYVGRAAKGDKTTWYFVDETPGHVTMDTLGGVLRHAAYNHGLRLAFAAEVEAYDGPMDVEDATAECVDCHAQVSLLATLYPGHGHEVCPNTTSHNMTGHRVSRNDAKVWEHQRKVIAAKKASWA